jgi:hypothetical protein
MHGGVGGAEPRGSPLSRSVTRMYGPAVRRKRFSSSCRFAVLHQCIRPLIGACAPGHHGYQRACVLISGQASTGPNGSPRFAHAGKTDPPSRLTLSQTSAGNGLVSGHSAPLIQFLGCHCRSSLRMHAHAGCGDGTDVLTTSKSRSLLRTAQAMRASLLASAIASTL